VTGERPPRADPKRDQAILRSAQDARPAPASTPVPTVTSPAGTPTSAAPALGLRTETSATGNDLTPATKDYWMPWLIALCAIVLPGLVLVLADSIPRDTLVLTEVKVSVQRGDFLIPVLILCLDTIRRWWREVEQLRFLKTIRGTATFMCGAAALVCLIATTTAATVAVTPDTGKSITNITVACLVVAVAFGTLAVAASKGTVNR